MRKKKLPQSIDYELLVEDALRSVTKRALDIVADTGLPGENHFYITFKTDAIGVQIPKVLQKANPDEMTIVFQHQFWDLVVTDEDFSATMTFSSHPHHLKVPFSAITQFSDPSVGFGLQFSIADNEDNSEIGKKIAENDKEASKKPPKNSIAALDNGIKKSATNPMKTTRIQEKKVALPESAEIVSLDKFRKNSSPSPK